MFGSEWSSGSEQGARTAVRRPGRTRPGLIALAVVAATAATALLPIGPAAAADTDIVINEFMFSARSDLDGDEFLELANRGTTSVDLSGWCFSGITLCFPVGTSIAAGGYVVVARDAVRYQQTYGAAPAAVYTGGLSNSGETITLRNAPAAGAVVIDTVAYTDRNPWPTTTDGTGPSLELIDSSLNNDDSLNWAASVAISGSTPGAANSVAATGLKPRITAVTATPTVPAVNQPVTVSATITGQTGALVRYRVNFGAQQTIAMTSAGGDSYTATVPGAAAGQLIRYRVEATNGAGTSTGPRTDDSSPFAGVVVANGITSAIPVLEWFIDDADYNMITQNPTIDINRPSVIAYNGQVFDNATVNIRGQNSQTALKPNWKIEMPKNHEITFVGTAGPVDEFAMQADWSDHSRGRPLLAWDSYQTVGNVRAQVFPIRTQRNGTFQGLYTYIDLFDGTWRDREGYSAKQFFKSETSAFVSTVPLEERRFEKKNPADGDFSNLRTFLDGVALTGTAQANHLRANVDIPQMLNYAVATAITQHTDSSRKNWYLAQDSATGRWTIIPWDLDHTFGNDCCNVVSPMVTPAEPQDQTSALMVALLAVPEFRQMYFRRLRTTVDQVLATGRPEGVYDARVGPAAPEFALDFARWPVPGFSAASQTYAAQRTWLFNALNARRSAFANDSRVPAAQPANPNIVIDEIQHSPLAGTGAEFVELYNPSTTQAIDISGWVLSGAIDLVLQPGTVIVPGGRMTFVKDDATFRASQGGTVVVGGRFGGDLAPGETLTLTRASGTVADTVTFGGAGWPDASNGRSLELVNLAADNADPANWALSPMPAGSPGAVNQTVFPGSAPGAPGIGTAVTGANSATVQWTAPTVTGGAAINGYVVRVADSGGAQVGALRPASPNARSLVVSGLTAGSAYTFQVSAVNVAGVGAASASSNAVTVIPPSTPARPVIGTASSGTAGSPITAIARWTPPTSTGSSPIVAYRVTALQMSSTAAGATVLGRTEAPIRSSGNRSYTFTLPAGIYRFEVEALNATGWSPLSARSGAVTAQ
jgi:hypothetical protein